MKRRIDVLEFIVVETLRSALRDTPQNIESEAARILPGLRSALGNDRYYIPATPPALAPEDDRRRRIVADAMSPMPTEEVERRHGVSRSTVYRLVKRFARGEG